MEVAMYNEEQFNDIQMNYYSCHEKKERATLVKSVQLSMDGKYADGDTLRFTTPEDRPQVWFFALMDCDRTMHKSHKNMPRLEVEFTLKNDKGSNHFSYEDNYQLELHLFLIAVFALLFGTTIYSYIK